MADYAISFRTIHSQWMHLHDRILSMQVCLNWHWWNDFDQFTPETNVASAAFLLKWTNSNSHCLLFDRENKLFQSDVLKWSINFWTHVIHSICVESVILLLKLCHSYNNSIPIKTIICLPLTRWRKASPSHFSYAMTRRVHSVHTIVTYLGWREKIWKKNKQLTNEFGKRERKERNRRNRPNVLL